MASYRDGTGGYREKDGSFYDFVIESNESGGNAVRGASIKSKELARLMDHPKHGQAMRAHLEISNSYSKDWKLCAERGVV